MVRTVAVTSSIPYPGPQGRAAYPWRTMRVGESFFCENVNTARGNAVKFGRLLGRQFRTVAVTEEVDGVAVSGARVWRVLAPGEVEEAPPKAKIGGRYPWASTEVGGSFFVRNRQTAEEGCERYGAKLGRTFRCEPVREMIEDKLCLGARVTRIA